MAIREDYKIERSALWAAYGDALGFITELADADRVRYRSGDDYVAKTKPWKRKIGGRIGSQIELGAGTYSDDTQLRLATSRAIRADGSFDLLAFSKIELPVWLNYALGAGIGTKEAASSLARTSATWYANFFNTKRSAYERGGGNGAAMRIQPHVWSAKNLRDHRSILLDVIKNSICTHGNPTGIVGACYHALVLMFSLEHGRSADLQECSRLVSQLGDLPSIVEDDHDLRLLWIGPWLDLQSTTLDRAFSKPIADLAQGIKLLDDISDGTKVDRYVEACTRLQAFEPETRGSATMTALLASYLAWLYSPFEVEEALVTSANTLGTDTDSIATMVGAVLGCNADDVPRNPVQDREYLIRDAKRLAAIARSEKSSGFRYPDLRAWKPPRNGVDAVVKIDEGLSLLGLGQLTALSDHMVSEGSAHNVGWYKLSFGQTIIARVRNTMENLDAQTPVDPSSTSVGAQREVQSKLPDLFANTGKTVDGKANARPTSLNDSLKRAIASDFDPKVVGELILAQVGAGNDDFVERGVALTATILTALEARIRKGK